MVETLHKEKDIPKDVLFESLEIALVTAARRRCSEETDLVVRIDRNTGGIRAFENGIEMRDAASLGRIAAQTAKQVFLQKIREAEQDNIFRQFEIRKRTLLTGTVQRFEGETLIVNIGKTEAVLPRHERMRGENLHVGDRVRALVYDVRKVGPNVRIILSRTHPDLVRRLLELEVPEIADGIIEIRRLAREPGYRTKVAVFSNDPRIDCVGACVGVRGARIRNITEELNGERIDVIRWSEEPQSLIMNALKPAEIVQIALSDSTNQADVSVRDDELSLAIGKRGQNVRLAAKLTGWDINIVSASDSSIQAVGRADPEDLVDAPGLETGRGVTEMIATQVLDAAGEQLELTDAAEADASGTEPGAKAGEDGIPGDGTGSGDAAPGGER